MAIISTNLTKIGQNVEDIQTTLGDVETLDGDIATTVSNKLDKTGDSTNVETSFTSNDTTKEVTSWTEVDVLVTGEKHNSLFSKMSTMFKNVRYLYKLLGTTDISKIGDGTVTNAISTINNKVDYKTPAMYLFECECPTADDEIVSEYNDSKLSNLGLNHNLTFEECLSIILENYRQFPNHFIVRVNNNQSVFNRSLPYAGACIIEFLGTNSTKNRQCIKLYSLTTGDMYIGTVFGSNTEYSFNGWIKLMSEDDLKTLPVYKSDTLENGSFVAITVKNGIAHFYLDLYPGDIPTLAKYSTGTLFTLPKEYCPITDMMANPQLVDAINDVVGLQGCAIVVKPSGNVYLSTRHIAISATGNATRSYTRMVYVLAN